MSAGKSDYDVLMYFMTNFMKTIHTIKPAVVTSVNGNKLSCRVTTRTRFSSTREEDDQPDCIDVPYMIISGKRGQARITMPITAGDLVVVLFSDRGFGDLLDTDGKSTTSNPSVITHNYDPILALPCFFTSSDEAPPSGVVEIKNGDSKITMEDDGTVAIEATKFSITNGSSEIITLLQTIASLTASNCTSLGNTTGATNATTVATNLGQYIG